jgi:hypothetical protein
MESILSNFDIEDRKNFWKLYPSWKTPKELKALYSNDKSKGKDKSSLVMWGIAHMFDKTQCNPYKDLDSQERVSVISDDLMDNSKFDWSKYDNAIECVSKMMMNEDQRNLNTLIEYEDARRRIIEKNMKSLDFDKIKQCDDAIKRNVDLAKEKDRLKASVALSESDGKVKGDRIESASEKGLI